MVNGLELKVSVDRVLFLGGVFCESEMMCELDLN